MNEHEDLPTYRVKLGEMVGVTPCPRCHCVTARSCATIDGKIHLLCEGTWEGNRCNEDRPWPTNTEPETWHEVIEAVRGVVLNPKTETDAPPEVTEGGPWEADGMAYTDIEFTRFGWTKEERDLWLARHRYNEKDWSKEYEDKFRPIDEMVAQACGNCLYLTDVYKVGCYKPVHQCHRLPPGQGWPAVELDEWCGSWQRYHKDIRLTRRAIIDQPE